MRRILFLIIFIPACSHAQQPEYKKLSCPEKWWVILHPFAAKKAFNITVDARKVSKEVESDSLLDHDADGGQVDAFRHSFWMARMAQEMRPGKARSLGKAHERGNYLDWKKHRTGEETFSDSIAGAMDLFNNEIGIETGHQNKSLSKSALQKLLTDKILKGEMKIIFKDDEGHSLDCNHKIIDMHAYIGKWNIPRCLVNSSKK